MDGKQSTPLIRGDTSKFCQKKIKELTQIIQKTRESGSGKRRSLASRSVPRGSEVST
jgi:hypothetical protein